MLNINQSNKNEVNENEVDSTELIKVEDDKSFFENLNHKNNLAKISNR